jgi:hypothetical protein
MRLRMSSSFVMSAATAARRSTMGFGVPFGANSPIKSSVA